MFKNPPSVVPLDVACQHCGSMPVLYHVAHSDKFGVAIIGLCMQPECLGTTSISLSGEASMTRAGRKYWERVSKHMAGTLGQALKNTDKASAAH